MNELITIEKVRGFIGENGIIFLNLEDVARGLGFVDVKNEIEYIRWNRVEKYLKDFGFATSGENDFIPENIFYLLAMKGKNEIAKNFQLKVANKILPAIRKTGMYATEELLNNPDLAIQAFMKLKEEMIRRQELEKKIEEQQPKVEFYNDVTGSDTTAEIGTVAKVLNFKSVGRNTLFDILRRQGILQRDNMPFQTYVDRGYFRVVESKWNAPNGDVKVNYKTVVYQKGIEYISKILRDLGYEKVGGMLN
ncbi:phage antirepressor KilAC domain-containing protein [Leptotrichia shahii]|uniref:phage antirepressor KilAC domain-containing protein n=1 Tax=Leptotrichia shahii TaxID=157691 RepID=UPI0028D1AEB9|nr:phage antirepressor KilAC domain-containing protein [Leptotrichia shahii]